MNDRMNPRNLLSAISSIYTDFFKSVDYRCAFDSLLKNLLDLTESGYGFIGEVLYTKDGLPYLKTHAVTGRACDHETRDSCGECAESGLELYDLKALSDEALRTGRPLIANGPFSDTLGGGLPEGRPPLNTFLGIPLSRGDSLIGMVGIANRPGGYDEKIIGYLDAFLKACTDIIDSQRNERKRREAELALRHSEEHYKGLFEASPISLWEEDFSGIRTYLDSFRNRGGFRFSAHVKDNPGEILHCASLVRIIDVNAATLKLFKAKNKEDLMAGLEKVLTDNSIDALRKGLIALAEGRTFFESECINRTLDGDELHLYIRWSIVPGHEENWSRVVVSLHDLTALKQAEEYLKRILETVDEGFVIIDKDLTILSANPAYMNQLKKCESDILGRKCHEVSHDKGRPCFEEGEDCPVIRTFRTGKPSTATHLHHDTDGRKFFVEIKSYPLADSSGNVTSVIKTIVDISERKKHEEELLRTQKLESIGLLAGGIAHDFNNLLMGVSGHISLLKLTADSSGRSYLEEAEKALVQARALTQQLLTFSKGGEPIKKPLRLPPIVHSSAKFALSGTSITYRFSSGDNLPVVEVDEGQINQVIQNIVINAVEAMPHGGTLTVTVEDFTTVRDGSSLKPDTYVKVSIADTGIGIPREHVSRVFDPYFTTKKKGSGLGLATSYSIMKRHGGLIEVDSEPGKGSTFALYLPASEKKALRKKTAREELIYGEGKILVMDDEEVITIVCGEMLKSLGYRPEFAINGEETLTKYKAAMESGEPYDAVILDLTIRGGMGGAETIKLLHALDPRVNAVVSSGYAEDPIMANYRDYGFNAVLVKPYQLGEFSTILHDLLV